MQETREAWVWSLGWEDPLEYPGSSVHGILQARIPVPVAFSFSRGSSQPRGWTWVSCVSCIGRQSWFFISCATRESPCEALSCPLFHLNFTTISEAGKGGVTPITQIRKLRVREVRWVGQDLKAKWMWGNWDLNPWFLILHHLSCGTSFILPSTYTSVSRLLCQTWGGVLCL